MKIDLPRFAASIIGCQAAGFIGSVFTAGSVDTWYTTLVRPVFAPPNWIFGPVWITLYLMMGVSVYLIWTAKHRMVWLALVAFAIQLVLNTVWSFLFFGLQDLLLGFLGIIFLWAAIVVTIAIFYRIRRSAAYLLVPYLLWVSFAAVLNYGFLVLN